MAAADDFDILFAADARFPGGTSTALATEIGAAAKAGFRAGLLQVNGPVLRRPHPFHRDIRAAIDRGDVAWADPARRTNCRLLIVHHPTLFPAPLERSGRIAAEQAVIVAHHPPTDGEGAPQYDIREQVEAVAEAFDRRPDVAPVGPNVRARFRNVPTDGVQLVPVDWHNLIDPQEWPARPFRPFGDPIVIGRHTRPDPLKWPDDAATTFAAYPSDPDVQVKVLGAGAFLAERLGAVPPNWQLIPFGGMDAKAFLAGLDAYVYFHSAKWVEAFGRNVLEALATGLVTILPPSFEPLFGAAAVYAAPDDVRDILTEFRDDPASAKIQAKRARAAVEERFSADRFKDRLAELYGLRPNKAGARRGPATRSSRGLRTVLFVSSNGIGLGHLTRQIGVARRLPPWLRPVFFSLSRAVRLAREAGFLVEHTAFHRYLDVPPERWNAAYAEELLEAILFHRPAALVFDGNVPYRGLVDAIDAAPDLRTIWIRRAMWREHHASALARAAAFDAVIEPGELAAAEDFGPTRAERDNVHLVDPVVMLRPGERLPREEARKALGIADGRLAVALQLGAGNNFEFAPIRRSLLDALLRRNDVDVLEFASPISEAPEDSTPLPPAHRLQRLYPSFRYSRAFDFAVSAAGYNSFHENVLGRVPTLFIANEAEEMDEQASRAAYADRRGLARFIRARDVYAADQAIAELADWRVRAEMRERCGRLTVDDGALQIARFIEETVYAAHTRERRSA